jgi:hypothetical protein
MSSSDSPAPDPESDNSDDPLPFSPPPSLPSRGPPARPKYPSPKPIPDIPVPDVRRGPSPTRDDPPFQTQSRARRDVIDEAKKRVRQQTSPRRNRPKKPAPIALGDDSDDSSGAHPRLFDDERPHRTFFPGDFAFLSDSNQLSEFLALETLAGMSSSAGQEDDPNQIVPLPESELTFGIGFSLLDSSSGSDSGDGYLDEGAAPARNRRKTRITESADSYQSQSESEEARLRTPPPGDSWASRHREDSDSDSVSDLFKRNP